MDGCGSRFLDFVIPWTLFHSIINIRPKEEVDECIEK